MRCDLSQTQNLAISPARTLCAPRARPDPRDRIALCFGNDPTDQSGGNPTNFYLRFSYPRLPIAKAAQAQSLMNRQEALVRERTMRLISSFVSDRSGATAIEYSMIAAGIALVIVAVVNGIGTTLNTTFSSVQTGLK